MRPELIVAVKEFKDYLTSKVFLIVFGLLVLMMVASVITGMGTYNDRISQYNSLLSAASKSSSGIQPVMPSMMLVFESFSSIFVAVGWVLAIVIGFSLISKEKETGSLKLLLARPTFRDSIINGKILGAASMLVISLAATFLVGLALLLFEGVTPTQDDLLRLGTFFLVVVLFSVAFLAISIAASAIAKNSTIAILLALIIAVFSLMVPYFTDSVCQLVLGQAPTMLVPATTSGGTTGSAGQAGNLMIAYGGGRNNSTRNMVQMEISPDYTSYMNKRDTIAGIADLISPTSDLSGISRVVVNGQQTTSASLDGGRFQFNERGMGNPTLGSTLPAILPQVLALLVMMIAGFAITYAKFIRMDVR